MPLKYKNIIDQMTLEEKASLMSGKNFWETQEIERLNVPSIFLADGPHGIRKQIAAADHLGLNESRKATCFPTASALASSWNVDLVNKVGIALGKEARYQDVNVLLGPGMNTKRNVLCGRNFEYFSEDPYLAGNIAGNIVKGIQESGVSACLKHFACNSQELRRMNVDSVMDERALRELYLTNFEIAVKVGKPNCIMSSYNLVNGDYTNQNMHLSNILRNEWGYKGVMVTDWGGEDDRVKGLLAGNELEMPTNAGDTNRDILRAIESGELDVKVLDTAVDRLLDLVFKTQKDPNKDYSIDLDAHNQLATEAAEESIVLLENDGVLPLNKEDKVCVIGKFAENTRYQGAGSSNVNSYKVDKMLDILPTYGLNYVGYEPGFKLNGKPNKSLLKKAVKLANTSDTVILMLGLDELSEAEGIDRASMKIPQNQIDLFNAIKETGKKIVVCLCTGSAVELPFASDTNALVHYHLCGQAAVDALLNVISGKVNPSGKLSESYPIKYEDSASSNYFHKKTNTAEYRDSIYVGYRYYDKVGMEVRYPFGYGKSYTTFEYSDLTISEDGIKFNVKNTGSVEGKEVAEMYVSLPESKVFRAVKELKGFVKVNLKPGEAREVTIPFDEFTFRFFNVKSNKWEVEGGKYLIQVGSSSRDISLESSIEKAGNMQEVPYDAEKIPSYYSGNVADVNDEEFKEVLGRDIPNGDITFKNKRKTRIVVDAYTTVEQLRYAPGWTGRAFAGVIRFVAWLLPKIGQGKNANTIIMGVYHQPLRGISRFSSGAVHWEQLNGLIIMFNGKFFKGLHTFFSEGRRLKKERKAKEKLAESK
ncbi:MAG: glycoside hydrolase family 3 C-terminal domain-containing protein [Bacilli bacterium]|nr:glycoside hydrolase family 3 C-terminal domain-containing protein [Bacilli bacterium]